MIADTHVFGKYGYTHPAIRVYPRFKHGNAAPCRRSSPMALGGGGAGVAERIALMFTLIP